MRPSLQLGVLLCVLCAAHLQAQEKRNSLRLCGRALVRALVFTCGGSRWRRQLEETGSLPDDGRDRELFIKLCRTKYLRS
uniref:Insulin-like domain-containing protein n=1 Tax=Fundulus heteroclitus TaxID=8078 RepID=A0A3Q2PJJ4_FUNHE